MALYLKQQHLYPPSQAFHYFLFKALHFEFEPYNSYCWKNMRLWNSAFHVIAVIVHVHLECLCERVVHFILSFIVWTSLLGNSLRLVCQMTSSNSIVRYCMGCGSTFLVWGTFVMQLVSAAFYHVKPVVYEHCIQCVPKKWRQNRNHNNCNKSYQN